MDDTISRQAAIEAIDEISREVDDGDGFDYAKWREYFCELPPVHGTNLAEVGADAPYINVGELISRKSALDICDNAIDLFIGQFGAGVLVAIKESIEELPSAQPETAKRIVGKSRDGMTLWYQCDMCNEPVDAQDNFCRGCGRRLTDG